MILLKQTENLNIIISEHDVIAKTGNIKVQKIGSAALYPVKTDYYDPLTNKSLLPHLKKEAMAVMDSAIANLKEIEKQFSKTEKPSSGLGDKLENLLLQTIANQSIDEITKEIMPKLEKHIIDTFGVLPQKHEVYTPKGKHEFEGVTHEVFDKVLNLVNLDIPVFLSGAAGTGKNVICKQVAEALGLEFYFTNAVTQEYQLKGFIDANGKYHETQFYRAFTQGGLFFLDEMDGSIPETLIILNSAIANRYFDFPIGKIEAHPDFRIISAGNTVGTGADIEYTGRFQLDASSLDRFALITVDYSEAIEKAVTNNDEALISFAHEFRRATEKCGIRCLCTYRALERIEKLKEIFDLPEVLTISLTKGLSIDDITILAKELKIKSNPYIEALKTLAK